jgi:lambda repressor-like predicted transcriptional regulator
MNTLTNTRKKMQTDGNIIASQLFAEVFQAYLECSNEVQVAIRDMVKVVHSSDATDDERSAALFTIAEALFPSRHNGALGFCLETCEKEAPREIREVLHHMNKEEATFANRLEAALESKGMTQGDLAAAIGVGQPAISMMISRNCRPQRRTVEKIANVLKVAPEELWPGIQGD